MRIVDLLLRLARPGYDRLEFFEMAIGRLLGQIVDRLCTYRALLLLDKTCPQRRSHVGMATHVEGCLRLFQDLGRFDGPTQ